MSKLQKTIIVLAGILGAALTAGSIFAVYKFAPKLLAMTKALDLDGALGQITVYSEIKKSDPELYQELKTEIMHYLLTGAKQSDAMKAAQEKLAAAFFKHLPKTSDAAIQGFMRANIAAIKEICVKDSVSCFDFTFKPPSGRTDFSGFMSKPTSDQLMESMGKVILDARSAPFTGNVDRMKCQDMYTGFAQQLQVEYGGDVAKLANPTQAGADKGQLLRMTLRLYEMIFAQPEGEASRVLRCMFTN